MAEATVSVPIGEYRSRDRIGRAAEERMREHRALKESRVAPNEIGSSIE
jgi:hypothetical protein